MAAHDLPKVETRVRFPYPAYCAPLAQSVERRYRKP